MRRICKLAGAFVGFILLLIGGICAWLYLYTADLPHVSQLDAFNPSSEAEALLVSCDRDPQFVWVVPAGKLGKFTIAALVAAVGEPESRSPYFAIFSARKNHTAGYEVQLAKTLSCGKQRPLSRAFQELRLANQIHRRFSQPELLTIYLNRVYLGADAYGVEAAAEKYFGKPDSSLTLEETALVVGLIRAPNYYSPKSHPDRALERRNAVLDQMVAQGSLSRNDAELAKARPLQVLEQLRYLACLDLSALPVGLELSVDRRAAR